MKNVLENIEEQMEKINENFEMPYLELNEAERNSLYCLAGHLISKIAKSQSLCVSCLSEILLSDHNEITLNKNAQLSLLKAEDIHKFKYVKDSVFNFFYDMETVCNYFIKSFQPGQKDMHKSIIREINNLKHPFTNDCDLHEETSSVIIKRFVMLRLRISTKKQDSLRTFNFDSYSLR